MAPVAARRGTILAAVDDDDADDEDIAVRRPLMVREERAPEESRLSMVTSL